MTVKYDIKIIEELRKSINNWEVDKAKSEQENWDYDKYENSLNTYLNTLEKYKKEYGIRKIGKGRNRIVFTGGSAVQGKENYVIKISLSDGLNQNRDEVELYQDLPEDVREHVADIVAWDKKGYRWIIQERVSQASPPSSSKKLAEKLNDLGWECSDIRPDNIGVSDNGEPILIDYGIGLRRK